MAGGKEVNVLISADSMKVLKDERKDEVQSEIGKFRKRIDAHFDNVHSILSSTFLVKVKSN
jgi:hypothetical protein